MDGVVFAWTIVATLLGGLQLFFQKVVAQQKRNSALNGIFMYGFQGIVAFGILFVFYSLPPQWPAITLFALAAGVTHAIGNFIRIEALKNIDSVLFFPLNKILGPIIVVIGGLWWFGDSLVLREYIGIAFSLTVPLLLISSVEHHRQNNLRQGLIFLVLSTILTSGSMLFIKQGTLYDSTLLFLMGITQVAAVSSSVAIFLREKHVRDSSNFGVTREDVYLGLIASIFGFLSFYALLKAFSMGTVSLIYVIHAHYILVPIVLSIWWYREHIDARKIAAVALSFLAITLLI